jgi:hypothetical protein
MTYKIVRFYMSRKHPNKTIKRGLTRDEALMHCKDPETSSRTATSEVALKHTEEYGPWFDGYGEEFTEVSNH